jgi:hypothetical protein
MTAAVVQTAPLTPPSVSLISAAIAAQESDERWVNGFLYQPEGCGAADIFDICNNNDPSAGFSKTISNNTTPITGTPVGVVAQDTCSTWGWQVADYRARATRMLLAVESFKLARELWEGTTGLNVSLMQAGVASTVNTGVTALDAIGQLEQSFYNSSPAQRAMIHASPRFVEFVQHISGGAALRREGNVFYTYMDTIVAVDKGYRGKGPNNAAGEWLYITPIVTVRRGAISIVPDDMSEALLRKQNQVTFFAERPVSATWDYNCQTYALSVDFTAR